MSCDGFHQALGQLKFVIYQTFNLHEKRTMTTSVKKKTGKFTTGGIDKDRYKRIRGNEV